MLNYVLALIVAAESTANCGLTEAALQDVQRVGVFVTMDECRQDRATAILVMKTWLRLWCNEERLGRTPDTLDYLATYRAGPDGWRNKYDWWHYMEQGKRNLKQHQGEQ